MKILLLILIIVCVVGFLFFTTAGKRIRIRAAGTADEVASKDASTPEGATAYYNASIDKLKQDKATDYGRYTKIVGQIKSYEDQIMSLKKENMKLDMNINACLDKGDDNGAKQFLTQQSVNTDKIETLKQGLVDLKNSEAQLKEMLDQYDEHIEELIAEKETSVMTLEVAQTVQSLKAASGCSTSEKDKMLDKVRDGVKKAKQDADGVRIAYESSASVQQQRLDKQMKDDEVQRKLDQLKAARKK